MRLYANYHTHTRHCGHATGTEREYIEKAIDAGTRILGFSDHAPYRFPDGYVSQLRMAPELAEDYFRTLTDLKKEYAGQIEIHVGVEAEYYPDLFEDLLSMLRQYPCEYMLLGQHCLGNEYDREKFLADTPAMNLNRYVNQILEGLSTGLFTYLAHPDYFKCQGDAETYQREMERLCRGAKEMGIPLEINLNGMRGRTHYPAKTFWAIAGQIGNDVVVGTDHHYPDGIFVENLGTDPYDPCIHGNMDIVRQLNEILSSFALTPLQTVPLRPIGKN